MGKHGRPKTFRTHWTSIALHHVNATGVKCPYRQNFYIRIWSYILGNKLRRKYFRFGWKAICYKLLKTWKSIVFSCGRPVPLNARSACSETKIQELLTLFLNYLACFTSVHLASYSMQNTPFQHFLWTTKLNLQR